jgi:hypothetical protein
MKTIEKITPSEAGLSVKCSAPSPGVDDNWPHILYDVEILKGERSIWKGPYKLGIGHVKTKGYEYHFALSMEQKNCLKRWHLGGGKKWNELRAETAAALARIQKVVPKLEDVMHSLLMDGQSYFDGQSFEEWCDELGYNSDSIKHKKMFDDCCETGRSLVRNLSYEILSQLREWASEY